MVKPLTFKGDKKPKKRKRTAEEAQSSRPEGEEGDDDVAATEDDSWVSAEAVTDLVGPVMMVLSADDAGDGSPPYAMACDPSGKVFAQAIENIVDGNHATAEPHDVRQVWLASQITGSPNFRFKGHNGKYLGFRLGKLLATSDAVSEAESFKVVAPAPGAFRLQTPSGTFVAVKTGNNTKAAPEVCGDGQETDASATIHVRMQARFKPRLKAAREDKAREKISRRELEEAVGRRLEDGEVKRLKRAKREGDYYEQLLDLKVKNKHDKYG